MNQAPYGIIKQASPQFPVRELLVVPHGNNDLTVGYPAFGRDTYERNLEFISRDYSHPKTGERISFRPSSTHESISVAACGFGSNEEFDAKRDIFDLRCLQAGYIVRTKEGVFTNTQITNEEKLKSLLIKAEKVKGIYLIDDIMAFAPYESFQRGVQDCDTFAQGGLARALEHTSENVANNLREITSHKHYKGGVNVWDFDDVKKPILKVVSLYSNRDIDGGRLDVNGYDWNGYINGYAFGVLNKSAEGTRIKK